MILPGNPTGQSAMHTWLRKLRAAVESSQVTAVVGGRLNRGPNGTQIIIDRQPTGALSAFHPFKVYQSPSGNTDAETIDGWRKVLVRSGKVGIVDVTGTDAAEYPYSREVGVTTDEIIVDNSVDDFVVWIAYLPDTANDGASAAASIDSGAGGWTGYPGEYTTEGTIMIPIAILNTMTEGVLKVRQLVTTDLPNFMQVCVSIASVEQVLNIPCLGYPFTFA